MAGTQTPNVDQTSYGPNVSNYRQVMVPMYQIIDTV